MSGHVAPSSDAPEKLLFHARFPIPPEKLEFQARFPAHRSESSGFLDCLARNEQSLVFR